MANSFEGLLPNGQLPSRAEAQVRDLISTEAPPPDLSAYSTTAEVRDLISTETPPPDLSAYSTTAEVRDLISTEAPPPDLSAYYTAAEAEGMVDDKIESAMSQAGDTIPIFATLAEAQAWELANPGRAALTIESPPDPGAWTAAAPLFSVHDRTYTVPTDAGATYQVNGVAAAAGTYQVGDEAASVTVQAVARMGYTLVPPTSWMYSWPVAPAETYTQAVLADAPVHFLPLDDQAGVASVRNLGLDGRAWTIDGAVMGGAGIGALAASATLTSAHSIKSPDPELLSGALAWSAEAVVALDGTQVARWAVIGSSRSTWGIVGNNAIVYAYHNGAFVQGGNTTPPVVHLCVVYDGSTIRVYLNGVDIHGVTAAGPVSTVETVPSIGRAGDTGLNGRVAGVAVYDHALSPARVLAHATSAGLA